VSRTLFIIFVPFVATSKSITQKSVWIDLHAGGHTAEMLTLLKSFDQSIYWPRRYIVASTDRMSGQKATAFEALILGNPTDQGDQAMVADKKHDTRKLLRRSKLQPTSTSLSKDEKIFSVKIIPRSREVGQSFITSVGTTLYAAIYAFIFVFDFRPDLVLINGPGTALPVVVAARAARMAGLADSKVVYVESIARVTQLSLTGKILYKLRLSDEFFVQWEELLEAYPRAKYAGRLM